MTFVVTVLGWTIAAGLVIAAAAWAWEVYR